MRIASSTRRTFTTTAVAALLSVAASLGVPAAAGAASVTTPAQRDRAAAVAASKAGVARYARGAAGPNLFDCSGLVDFAYRAAGAPLGVRTSQAMWNIGTHLTRTQVRRGDLVFTWTPGAGHVGVYVGFGKYVHAPAPGRAVEIAPLPPTGAGFYGAVRP